MENTQSLIPFIILPSTGFLNTQFQIIPKDLSLENILIEYENKTIKSIKLDSKNPILLTELKKPGLYKLKTTINNINYEKKIKVSDSIKLGNSILKSTYSFDGINYTFFLMKDRMMIYDEISNSLLYENDISPSIIKKINNHTLLFITQFKNEQIEVRNYAFYSIQSFNIIWEIKRGFKELFYDEEKGILWVDDYSNSNVIGYNFLNKTIPEIFLMVEYENYFITKNNNCLIVDNTDKVGVINLHNYELSEFIKDNKTAIDKFGNYYSLENGFLEIRNFEDLFVEKMTIGKFNSINLNSESYFYIGDDLNTDKHFDFEQYTKSLAEKYFPNDSITSDYVKKDLLEDERIDIHEITYEFYPYSDSVFVLKKETSKRIFYISYRKRYQIRWVPYPETQISSSNELSYFKRGSGGVKHSSSSTFKVISYNQNGLLFMNRERTLLLNKDNIEFEFNNTIGINFFSIDNENYLLQKEKNDKITLSNIKNPHEPLFKGILKFNESNYLEKKVFWCLIRKGDDNFNIIGFDLKNNRKIEHSNNYFDGFSVSEIKLIDFNKHTIKIEDQQFDYKKGREINGIPGDIIAISESTNSIRSKRSNIIYLNSFNEKTHQYTLKEIKLEEDFYNETYLSQNGKYLVAQKNLGEYTFYDIEKGEVTNYFSEKFLGFSNEGNLIFEKNKTRKAVIVDPITFQDITPDNYHYYRFISPNQKLYSSVSTGERYFDRIKNEYVQHEDFINLSNALNKRVFDAEKGYVDMKELFFEKHKEFFEKNGMNKIGYVNAENIIQRRKFTSIGLTGSDVKQIIEFPLDLVYYNYSAFSYDNKYYAYVGKPSNNGLIHFFKLQFNEQLKSLEIEDTYLTRLPKNAAWVCAFSKNGYFATYDSNPDTYLININDKLFDDKPSEIELNDNLKKINNTFFNHFNSWVKIEGKSFLCFSPTGKFIALSEQGYEPLTLGGYGHKESGALHISETETGKVKLSFSEHGDAIKSDNRKKITFVAFSEDEKKLMSLSEDGVVVIRNINISEDETSLSIDIPEKKQIKSRSNFINETSEIEKLDRETGGSWRIENDFG